MFKKLFIIAVFFLFGLNNINAQKFSEVGLGVGTYIYHGDLTKSIIVLEGFSYSASLFYRYNFNNPAFAVKAQLGYGKIQGYDYASGFTNRNLSFKSHLAELAIMGEINIIPLIKKNSTFQKFSPFLYVGVAGFNFNPKAELNGEWYELQPLHTEGQESAEYADRKEYKLTQISIPFGLDLRYNMTRKFFVGFDLGFRKTFTDYIDDVSTTYADNELISSLNGEIAAQLADRNLSGNNIMAGGQRGDSADKDWYFHFNFYVTYNFMSKKEWRTANKRMF